MPRMNAHARKVAGEGRWVQFGLDAHRYALPLQDVERIVRAVQVTPLPLAPKVVLGAVDVGGQILPVFNLRQRFQLPERPMTLEDQLLIARTAHRRVVLAIDQALGVIDEPTIPTTDSAGFAPDLTHIRGVISLPAGLVLIQDLERFLSTDEADALDTAIRTEEGRRAR
jgi:purine-binding chemotaxis protein CheW